MFTKKLSDTEIFHHDPDTDTSYIQTISDATPVVEAAKQELKDHTGGYGSEIFNKVGTVDLVVFKEWCKRKGISYQEAMSGQSNNKFFLMFLQDSDNSQFRTHPTYFKKL